MSESFEHPPFKTNYREDLGEYLNDYPNKTEREFLEYEIKIHKETIDRYENYPLGFGHTSQAKRSAIKNEKYYVQFLEDKLEIALLKELIQKPHLPEKKINSTLKWHGDDLQLTELIKSLIESKKITGSSEKEIFKAFYGLLGCEFDERIKKERLSTIRQRVKDKTPFLHNLELSLVGWIEKKDQDKHNK